jgi:hypothetical protein
MKSYLQGALVVSLACLQIGCSQQSESIKVVSDFWKGMDKNDRVLLESVLENKADAEFLSQGKSTLSDYEVLGESEGEAFEGVNVRFSRFCYADMIVPTILVEVDGKKKINFRRTLKVQMAAHKKAKPLRKYCYDFDEKQLSGNLGGKPWSFVQSKSRDIDWGDKVTTNITLYGESCDTDTYGKCTQPRLIISNLDLNSEGGNFTNKVNVTVHVPPGDNQVVSTGSYRVTQNKGHKKVELSFKQDGKNSLSGFYIVKGE